MTKLEKNYQKVANQIFQKTLKENRQRAKKFAYERELEETVLFHAKCIEKIYRKELPKDWKLKINIQILDECDAPRCSAESVAQGWSSRTNRTGDFCHYPRTFRP